MGLCTNYVGDMGVGGEGRSSRVLQLEKVKQNIVSENNFTEKRNFTRLYLLFLLLCFQSKADGFLEVFVGFSRHSPLESLAEW